MRILITPPSEAAHSCRECLVAWSRAGLLDPFCWWEADPHSEADSLEVLLVDHGREESLLLADALKESRPREVALVAFVPLDSASPVDHKFSDAVDRKVDVARTVLPYQKGSPLACAIVVAPAAIGMPVAEGLFSAERSANVYVAPEDRDDPEGVNALAANEARLPPHASHAIATITELWQSAGRNGHSVLDTLQERQPAIAPAPIQVVRCFTRGIDIGYLADHVAESVFLPGSAWPNPDPDRFDRLQDADALIDRAARAFLRKHRETLGPTEFEPIVVPPTDEVGLWEALKRLFWIIIDRIKRKPIEMIVDRVQRAHDWAAEKAEKIDGGATGIKIRRWARKGRSDDDFVELDEALERPLFAPEGPVAPTWSDLTGLALCLVDGRAWPEGLGKGISERGRKRVLVTDPFSIGPDPEAGYNHALGARERPVCDPLNDDPSMEKKRDPEASESGGPDSSTPSVASGGGADSGESDQQGELTLEVARGSQEGLPKEDLERVRASLLWRVGLAIARAQRRVKSEAESLRARQEAEQDPESDEAKEREKERSEQIYERSKSRIRGLIKTVVVSFIVVVIAVVLALELPPLFRIPALIALPVVWLLSMVFKARKILIEERTEEQDLLQQEVDKLNRKMLASLREGDAIRIARRYEEFKDWAEIIGWFVHTPWIGEPLEKIHVDAPVPPGSRPLAFQMATGVSDHDWLSGIGRVSQSHVFQPGWLNDLYSENQIEVLGEGAGTSSGSSGDTAGYAGDPAGDSSDDPDSPRRRWLRGVRRGDFRHIGDNAMTGDLLSRLDSLQINRAAYRVEEDLASDGQAEPLPLSPSWFSPPSNLDSLMRRVAPPVLQITATDGGLKSVGTGALLPGKETVITALHVVEGADGITVSYPEGGEVGAVLEKTAPDHDLAVLRLSEPIDRKAVELAESADLEVGGAIVSLGYRGGDSSPALSWGIITDVSRTVDIGGLGEGIEMIEANYRSARGSLGAPIFDLSGRMVGLHVGSRRSGPGDERLTYLSHAIPTEILHRLLAGDGAETPADVRGSQRSGLAAAERSGRRRAVGGLEPSEFFGELIDDSSEQAFLPGHWVVGSGMPPNEVETVISEPEVINVDDSLVSDYCEGNAFFRSLRLMVHRTDIAKPAAPDTLASLVNGRGSDSGN